MSDSKNSNKINSSSKHQHMDHSYDSKASLRSNQSKKQVIQAQNLEMIMQDKLKEYEKLRITFQKLGLSHQLIRGLKRMSYYLTLQNEELAQVPLLKQLISIASQLMMNELEVSYWHIVNNQSEIAQCPNNIFMNRLMMTALRAKKLCCEESEAQAYEAFLAHNCQKFINSFNQWLQTIEHDLKEISFFEVNDSFKDLFAEPQGGTAQEEADFNEDYNFIVDSLEDEHVRRAVHTTKTTEQIEEDTSQDLSAKIDYRKQRGRNYKDRKSKKDESISDQSETIERSRSRSMHLSSREKKKEAKFGKKSHQKSYNSTPRKGDKSEFQSQSHSARSDQKIFATQGNPSLGPMITIPLSTFNNFHIQNSQIMMNSSFQPKFINISQEIYQDSQTPNKNKQQDTMPSFNKIQSAESFGNNQYQKGSFTLGDLMRKSIEKNPSTPKGFNAESNKSQNSFITAFNDSGSRQFYLSQAPPTSFASSVGAFIQPFKPGQPQNLLNQNSLLKQGVNQASIGLPFNLNMNMFSGLPEFTDRNSFPAFFSTGNNKSGSFEISPNSSFVNYSRPQTNISTANSLNLPNNNNNK